jgi:hypothetical protein
MTLDKMKQGVHSLKFRVARAPEAASCCFSIGVTVADWEGLAWDGATFYKKVENSKGFWLLEESGLRLKPGYPATKEYFNKGHSTAREVEMIVDIDHQTISYRIDGVDHGVCFSNIDVTNLRPAVGQQNALVEIMQP